MGEDSHLEMMYEDRYYVEEYPDGYGLYHDDGYEEYLEELYSNEEYDEYDGSGEEEEEE